MEIGREIMREGDRDIERGSERGVGLAPFAGVRC